MADQQPGWATQAVEDAAAKQARWLDHEGEAGEEELGDLVASGEAQRALADIAPALVELVRAQHEALRTVAGFVHTEYGMPPWHVGGFESCLNEWCAKQRALLAEGAQALGDEK